MNKFDKEYIEKFQCVGSVEISGIGHVDVKDMGSLLIAEYFLEYMRGTLKEVKVRDDMKKQKKEDQTVMRVETQDKDVADYVDRIKDENKKIAEETQSVDEYLESDDGKKDTLTLMKKQTEKDTKEEVEFYRLSEMDLDGKDRRKGVETIKAELHGSTARRDKLEDKPKPSTEPVKRGRKSGAMMTCQDKVLKYSKHKANFKIASLIKRYPRFSEDEIMTAVSALISERKLRQMPKGILEVMDA